ncbi:MAG TPA: hypothetical protein VIZ20_03115 [Streptosporangiaceae bacterium]|jgi:hypothetical protein
MDYSIKSAGDGVSAETDQKAPAGPTALDEILTFTKRREVKGFQSSI